jgi:hypothetical protein
MRIAEGLAPRGALALVVGLGSAVALAAGCASVLGIDSDRRLAASDDSGPNAVIDAGGTDAQGADSSAAGDSAASWPPNYSCLGDAVPAIPSGNVQLQLFLNDVSTASNGPNGNPVPGAEIHACNTLDVSCASGFGSQTSDDAGIVTMSVPGGFDGYYEVRATNYTPAVLSRPAQYTSEFQDQGLAQIALIAEGGALAGLTQDPNLTIAVLTAEDCTSEPAANITFTVGTPGSSEQVIYLANNLPSKAATATDSESGSALIYNVPPGTLTVSASFADTGNPIRTISTIARQGWLTFILIRPDQATRVPIDGGGG